MIVAIKVSDEPINAVDKWLMSGDPPFYAKKIETYPKGKVVIVGLPATSELYLDQGYAFLISLAFPKGNDRHYSVFAASPSSNYDKLEPLMLEIIKSITPKTQS